MLTLVEPGSGNRLRIARAPGRAKPPPTQWRAERIRSERISLLIIRKTLLRSEQTLPAGLLAIDTREPSKAGFHERRKLRLQRVEVADDSRDGGFVEDKCLSNVVKGAQVVDDKS
jgi:hypothetical protein